MPTGTLLPDLRAVLFDVDGTLIDTLHVIVPAIGDTVERFLGTRPADEVIRGLIGVPMRQQMKIYGAQEADIPAMIENAIEAFEASAHLESDHEPAIEVLRLARARGLRTALVTSKSQPEVEPFLLRFSGADHVDTVVCATDVRHPKPDPESARLACERLGVEPAQAVLIGDSVYDLRCARDAGVHSVAVAYGAASRETLAAESPDVLVDTPDELLTWANTALPTLTCPARS